MAQAQVAKVGDKVQDAARCPLGEGVEGMPVGWLRGKDDSNGYQQLMIEYEKYTDHQDRFLLRNAHYIRVADPPPPRVHGTRSRQSSRQSSPAHK